VETPAAPVEAPRCHAVSEYVAALVAANVPVWLHGPAGTGKSSAAKYAADRADLKYWEVNLAGAMASAIKGKDRLKEFVPSEFAQAYEFGGVICLEEFDAAHPTVATAINNAIAGDHFANDADGRTIARHPDFRIVATANTLGTGATKEFNGRMKLDGATLDRFRMGRVYVGLDPALEGAIFASLKSGSEHGAAMDRFYREVQRLRSFVTARENFDVLTSMRVVIDGCKAIGHGVPVEGLLASIGATWQADTRTQAGIPSFDYAGWKA
jgi:cobaltochelatase CobS